MSVSKHILITSLMASNFTLGGCVIAVDSEKFVDHTQREFWQDRELNNRQHIQKLTLNTSIQRVTEQMGAADYSDIMKVGEKAYQVLYYRTQRKNQDGITTKDECTPIVFLNQNVVGWGESFINAL